MRRAVHNGAVDCLCPTCCVRRMPNKSGFFFRIAVSLVIMAILWGVFGPILYRFVNG